MKLLGNTGVSRFSKRPTTKPLNWGKLAEVEIRLRLDLVVSPENSIDLQQTLAQALLMSVECVLTLMFVKKDKGNVCIEWLSKN